MGFITGWVTNIILFILLATVIDMLLPGSAMQKYAKMTIGLLLIAVILTPVLNLFHKDFSGLVDAVAADFQSGNSAALKNLTESKKKEIQAEQDAYILEKVAVLLKTEVEKELIDKYQMSIADIQVEGVLKGDKNSYEDLNLKKITLNLEEAEADSGAVEPVAKIEILAGDPEPDQSAEAQQVKSFLARKWSVAEDVIEIAGKGDIEVGQ